MSYNLFFIFFLVIVTSLFVLQKRSHLKIERYVKTCMFYLTNVWQLGARLDLICRYTLVRIMTECDRY